MSYITISATFYRHEIKQAVCALNKSDWTSIRLGKPISTDLLKGQCHFHGDNDIRKLLDNDNVCMVVAQENTKEKLNYGTDANQ